MQVNQQRPATPAPVPVSNKVDARVNLDVGRSLAEQGRLRRDDRGLNRFGPLPGEVFSDEARFGSFS